MNIFKNNISPWTLKPGDQLVYRTSQGWRREFILGVWSDVDIHGDAMLHLTIMTFFEGYVAEHSNREITHEVYWKGALWGKPSFFIGA